MATQFDPAELTPSRADFEDPSLTPQEQEMAHKIGRKLIWAMAAMYLLPPIAILSLSGVALVALFRRATAEWFRFARQVRLEHWQLRQSLA